MVEAQEWGEEWKCIPLPPVSLCSVWRLDVLMSFTSERGSGRPSSAIGSRLHCCGQSAALWANKIPATRNCKRGINGVVGGSLVHCVTHSPFGQRSEWKQRTEHTCSLWLMKPDSSTLETFWAASVRKCPKNKVFAWVSLLHRDRKPASYLFILFILKIITHSTTSIFWSLNSK